MIALFIMFISVFPRRSICRGDNPRGRWMFRRDDVARCGERPFGALTESYSGAKCADIVRALLPEHTGDRYDRRLSRQMLFSIDAKCSLEPL
jgi:hypothetical protein